MEEDWRAALDRGFTLLPAWDLGSLPGASPDVLVIDARNSRTSVVCRAVVRIRRTLASGLLLVVEARDLSKLARRLPGSSGFR